MDRPRGLGVRGQGIGVEPILYIYIYIYRIYIYGCIRTMAYDINNSYTITSKHTNLS